MAGQPDDYTTGCLLNYTTDYLLNYHSFKEHHKLIEIDLSKQLTLDASSKAMQK